MKTHLRYTAFALAGLIVLSAVVCGGLVIPAQAGSVTVTVSGTPSGVSTCYIGAVEANNDFNVNQMLDLGINSYRIYGGTSRWEYQDDDGVYGSPTIAEIKADPDAVNWTWWDDVMTTPPYGTDYHWTDLPPNSWEGNARTIFQTLKDNGITPVVTLRNVDNADNPAWAQEMNPPNSPEDWNEWWEHVFATVYWFNVRNDYRVDHWQVHNEPNNSGQGWAGSQEDYFVFTQYTWDAVKHVYDTYLPGREYHVLAPVSGANWGLDMLINVPDYFNAMDVHTYLNDSEGYIEKANSWLTGPYGRDYPLWLSEWGSWHAGQYDTLSNATKLLVKRAVNFATPGDTYVHGSHFFSLYDWSGAALGVIHGYEENPTYTPGYYGMRLAIRGMQGCRTAYPTTSSSTKIFPLATQDAGSSIYLVVANIGTQDTTINADLSALVTSGTGTLWQFGAGVMDEITGYPVLSNGQVTFTVPGSGAALVKFTGGSPPPTDTPPPPTDTPDPPTDTPVPTDTPIPPTDTPVPPTDTPGGPTDTPEPPPTDTPVPPTGTPGSGTNLALGKPATASSAHSNFPASNAVDGDAVTYWRPVKLLKKDLPRPPLWIKVDLETSYTISQVTLTWSAAYERYATAYTVEVSQNDSDWTVVYSTTSGSGGTAVIPFSPVSARYARMVSTAWTIEQEGDYLAEFEVYE